MDLSEVRASAVGKSHPEELAKAREDVATGLRTAVAKLVDLASGQAEAVVDEYQPAGMVYIEVAGVKRLAYPDLPKDELVLVKRTVSKPGPQLRAIKELFDRAFGKAPTVKGGHAEALPHEEAIDAEFTDTERARGLLELLQSGDEGESRPAPQAKQA